MSIFSGLSTPKWMNPDEESYQSTTLGMQQAEQWHKQNDNKQARDDQQNKLRLQLANQWMTQQKQNQAAEWLHGNGTDGDTTRPWEAVSQHPELLLDPATAKGTAEILKASVAASKAKSGSLETKIALQQTSDFTKQLDTLNGDDPESVAAIRGMGKAKDGSPSANQWNALSLAQERIQLNHKQTMAQAEIDARARGDNVTVTTGPKGETITSKTPTATAQKKPGFQFHNVAGQGVIFDPATGDTRMMQKDGSMVKATPGEFLKIQKDLKSDDTADPEFKAYVDQQVKASTGFKPSTSAPPKPGQVVKGYKFKGGDPSQKSNWDKVNE